MATKNSTKNNWEEVTVIAGEPCLARLSLDTLLDIKDRVHRFYKGDDVSTLKSVLSSHSLIKPKVVLYDPNAESLRVCLDVVETGTLIAKALIVVVSGDSVDGRMSFYSKAQKNKRLINYPYIGSDNPQSLLKFLSGWQIDSGVNITGDGKKWILDNAPTVVVKLKSNTKKDVEVYDLECLDSELSKLITYCKSESISIDLPDLKEFCSFVQTNDIWSFISAVVTGDYQTALTLMRDIHTEHGLNGILWLLNSQIAFLVQVKDLVGKGYDSDGIASQMNYGRFFGKYTIGDWEEIDHPAIPAINPWRVKKAMETMRNSFCTMDRLMSQQQSVCNAIIDSRSGMPEDIIMIYLVLSLCGITKYPEAHLIV